MVGLAAVAAILFLVWYFNTIVTYIIVSAVFAVIGKPLVESISNKKFRGWSPPRWLASFVALLAIWVVCVAFFLLFVPLISHKIWQITTLNVDQILATLEQPLSKLQEYVSGFYNQSESNLSLSDTAIAAIREFANFGAINSIFTSTIDFLISTGIAIFSISFITYFFMKEQSLFYSMVKSLFPEKYADNVEHALDSVTILLRRYFRGIIAESFLIMVINSIILMLFGMSYADAIFIGFTVGVLNVIPYAGPAIGLMISISIGLIAPIDGMTAANTMILIAVVVSAVKAFDDFVIQPTLYSNMVKAHPLEIFIVILIAGYLSGVVGMLLAIPSYTILRVFAKEFFSQYSLVKKLTDKI